MSLVLALAVGPVAADAQPPRLVQPGAPGQPTREITPGEATDPSGVRHTAADVRFMQGMIGHHAQALEMTALLPTRTTRADLRALARRIEASQADEMAMMKEWLTQRGEALPDAHAHHGHGALMPGMLTPDEMQQLRAAQGTAFERLFLEGMIRHHEGALTMVRELFETAGAGQEPELFAFASDVEADQAMEIRRMRALVKELPE
jgi:uncharacterized protein (DUF305 family)